MRDATGSLFDGLTASDKGQPLRAVINGDCLTVMAAMPAESVDAIVTDPPYGLSFMGKDWDHGIPGGHFWREALRVAKPGAHLLAFGGTRTFHRLACAIEDAGWEIRDTIMWVYGSGFPKSLDVSKAIDKAAGAERELGPKRVSADGTVAHDGAGKRNAGWERPWREDTKAVERNTRVSYPATPAARRWSGWGTALKPAWEPVIVARKPLAGTVAENVLRHGTGAINVDGCRVGADAGWSYPNGRGGSGWHGRKSLEHNLDEPMRATSGRWPANLIHDGSDEATAGFPKSNGTKPIQRPEGFKRFTGQDYARGNEYLTPAYESPGYTDSGSAARFFYCAKASKADRDEGCEGMEERRLKLPGKSEGYNPQTGEWSGNSDFQIRYNHHPTVKPTDLMRYLCRLVTPPGGLVLDPFCGSGSTGKAAALEGFGFVGIELSGEYARIAGARVRAAAV